MSELNPYDTVTKAANSLIENNGYPYTAGVLNVLLWEAITLIPAERQQQFLQNRIAIHIKQ